MVINAAAKINLMLDIVGKADNGYHSLFMIMQSVGIFDTITVDNTSSGTISLTCSNSNLPRDDSNIAVKAAKAFFSQTGCINNGIHIDIVKRIPFEAGLAGGSADAAAVVLALDKMFNTNLSLKQLTKLALSIGSDVPFCLQGGTMLVQDIGGVLAELPDLPECFIVLAKPKQGVSTKEAYNMYDTLEKCRHLDKPKMLRAIVKGNLTEISNSMANVFEQFIEVTERVDIKNIMRQNGTLGHCMSGSGPTVFGIFETQEQADACAEQLKSIVQEVFVCKPVSCGCEIKK